jgi:prepilin-type N-terminal cleavage/methylation domain-containing protein
MRRRSAEAGVTLIEVLVAVILLSLLSLGMLYALRLGLGSLSRVDARLMDNRRVAGAQRILEQELMGLIPVLAKCPGGPGAGAFFQGQTQSMRLVSSFSLEEAWRGRPMILELFVIPGENGEGVRLVVNESQYAGPPSVGPFCVGMPVANPHSFVLADKLAYCRFSYLGPAPDPKDPGIWSPVWDHPLWPFGIRVEMAPSEPTPARLQPITVTVPIYMYRKAEHYAD